MKKKFDDLLQFGEPKWFEETGHPRFCDFDPSEVYNIYADEVALLKIACQGCGTEFKVAIQGRAYCGDSFSKRIIDGRFAYSSDPPNVGCCLAGATMLADEIEIVEFHKRDEHFNFQRITKLEIKLDEYDG